jgi:exosortase
MYLERDHAFSQMRIGSWAAIVIAAVVAIGFVAFLFVAASLSAEWRLPVSIFLLVSVWIAGFWVCFGSGTTRKLLFPLLFLYFLVPLPPVFLSQIITLSEHGSTEVTAMLFNIAGVPNFRTGDSFLLVDLKIVVAQQCSGIRSSMALLMTGLVLSHLCLRSFWGKAIFLALIPPLAIFKNGLRIFTLSVLSAYVSPRFLEGHLHRNGGILFFALTILVASLFLFLVQKLERICFFGRHEDVTH